jgi:hypothetical protein
MFDSDSDPDTRIRFISDLRQLADLLDANPGLPVPAYGHSITVHADSTDNGGRAQVDSVAAHLGMHVRDDTARGGHYVTGRDFGALSYRVIAIPEAAMQRHLALYTYTDCVAPDE